MGHTYQLRKRVLKFDVSEDCARPKLARTGVADISRAGSLSSRGIGEILGPRHGSAEWIDIFGRVERIDVCGLMGDGSIIAGDVGSKSKGSRFAVGFAE
jgi:hypothetical protein